jgi:hypothetical protein
MRPNNRQRRAAAATVVAAAAGSHGITSNITTTIPTSAQSKPDFRLERARRAGAWQRAQVFDKYQALAREGVVGR